MLKPMFFSINKILTVVRYIRFFLTYLLNNTKVIEALPHLHVW